MSTTSEISAIAHNKIVKASSIYKLFSQIIKPLVEKTIVNYNNLTPQLQLWNDGHDPSVDINSEYYSFLPITNQYDQNEIINLTNKINQIQQDWSEITESFDNNDVPLHVEHPTVIPATGRVQKYDYIGAYNFKCFLESLYAVIADIRNIHLKVFDKGKEAIAIGSHNSVTELTNLKFVTDDSLGGHHNGTYNFNDYILNNPLNGNMLRMPGDPEPQKHGYTGNNTLIPSNISNDILSGFTYTNLNTYGNQVIQHLRNETSADITSYYDVPSRTNSTFDFITDHQSGIVYDYLTLKPAENIQATSYKTVSDTLKNYFSNEDQEKNIIRSSHKSEYGKPQIISAETVRKLFNEMNQLVVKISASLYGEYYDSYEPGEIEIGVCPLNGLGYPGILSWYSGGTSETININNTLAEDSTFNDQLYTNYNATINNGHFIAKENNSTIKEIRAGYPYITFTPNETSSISDIIDAGRNETQNKKIASSIVPMLYNQFAVKLVDNELSGTNITNIASIPDTKKSILTSNILNYPNNLIEIYSGIYSDYKKQFLNRYCISHPYNLNALEADLNPQQLPDININTKYLFMPYMTYLNYLCANIISVYNGVIPNYDFENFGIPSDTPSEVSIISPASKIVNAAGIPIHVTDRTDLWDETDIIANPTSVRHQKTSTVQLKINDNPEIIYDDLNIDWIEYALKFGMSVNEVIEEHDGSFINKFTLQTPGYATSASVSFNYKSKDSAGSTSILPFNINASVPITSKLYIGLNSYNTNSESGEISNYLSYLLNDLMETLYADRFKFNDFYEDNNPLSKDILRIQDLEDYFICGSSNPYTKGNAVQTVNWVTKISGNAANVNFNINSKFTQDLGQDTRMIQGNFFFAANESNTLAINGKKCTYSFIPQPAPIKTQDAFIFENGLFKLNGTCEKFWNTPAKIDIYVKTNKQSEQSASIGTITPIQSSRPFSKHMPPQLTSLISENVSAYITYLEPEQYYSIDISADFSDISADLSSTHDLSAECSCTLRLYNENGGFRDICRTKNTTDLSAGLFRIPIIKRDLY